MLQCPQCTKPLRELVRRCPSCQADLDLLVDYVNQLQGGVERAESMVRAGELGQAVWAYLDVLEVDPDNGPARRQVSQVVAAVRQFDHFVPGRRWANNLPPLPPARQGVPLWLRWILIGTAIVLAFTAGLLVRLPIESDSPTPPVVPDKKHEQMGPPQARLRLAFAGPYER
jgi:hypothetical protein